MTIILKQIAQLAAALALMYAALLGATLLMAPRSALGDRLDTSNAAASLFLTEPKYVFLARSRLDTTADKAVLLGASNMLAGFRQREVQALVPNMEVHNLSVGGSNITQIAQIVDLIGEVQEAAFREHNTYVIGLWYGLFASDKARWYTPDRHGGDTDIDIERYRYGFYRRTEGGPVALLPPRELDVGVVLIHPYLVLDRTARDLSTRLRGLLSQRRAMGANDAQRDAVVVDDAHRRRYLDFWRDYMGGVSALDDEPFRVLDGIIAKIRSEGGRVVLVDMPIPHWHAQGAPLAKDYQRHIDSLFARLHGEPGVQVLRLTDTDDDADFVDEVHPKPRVTRLWAERLAKVLNAVGT